MSPCLLFIIFAPDNQPIKFCPMKITRTAPDEFNIWLRRAKGCELSTAELTAILISIELSTKYNLQSTDVFFELIIRYVVLCTLLFVNFFDKVKNNRNFPWAFRRKCVYLHCFQRRAFDARTQLGSAPNAAGKRYGRDRAVSKSPEGKRKVRSEKSQKVQSTIYKV